jgi:poly [ADP-ribose] polymerase 2/3/4
MSKFAVRKVTSPDTEGFTTTIKHVVLHCGNVVGNNNKYYCIELQLHPNGTYRIFTHYGRLNVTNIYEVRDTVDGRAITDRRAIEREFDRIVTRKKAGKKQEGGGTENYVEVDVSIPTVGSENIRGKDVSETAVAKTTKTPNFGYSHLEPECQRLVRQLLDENIHAITTSTAGALKLTSRGLETPLGPVTLPHIDNARSVLTRLKDQIDPETRIADRTSRIVIEANNEYYSLIPHDMGRKIKDQDWILDDKKVIDEFELLEQLSAAVQAGTTIDGRKSNTAYLDFHMEPLTDPALTVEIISAIRNSKARNHQNLDVWYWDVNKIFSVEIKKERSAFEQVGSKLGNQVSLFHGSKNQNCLSILFNGLIIPPHNAHWVTARMFGNGVYFASSSTKSLNYSTGFWGGMSNKYKNSFLFVVKVALGKTYKTKQKMSSGPPASYDSLHAQAADRVGYDGSLYNDEFIVYRTSQATIQYMVEMKRTR